MYHADARHVRDQNVLRRLIDLTRRGIVAWRDCELKGEYVGEGGGLSIEVRIKWIDYVEHLPEPDCVEWSIAPTGGSRELYAGGRFMTGTTGYLLSLEMLQAGGRSVALAAVDSENDPLTRHLDSLLAGTSLGPDGRRPGE